MSVVEQWKLRGPVRTLRSEFAEWDNRPEGIWQAPRRSGVVQFRPDGQIGEMEDHNPNGSISRSSHWYGEAGRLLESTFQIDDGPVSRTACRYDESGRLVRKIVDDGNGAESELETYSYDESGRKTKLQFLRKVENLGACGIAYGVEGAEQAFGAEGATTITTFYDDREQPCEALFHDENRALILRVILTRDTVGRLLKVESQCGDRPPFPTSQVLENTPAEERAKAAAVFDQLFGPQKVMWSASYQYDARGRRIERRTSMSGMSQDQTTWEYDEYDHPVREVEERTSSDLQPDESGILRSVNEKSFRHEGRHEYKYDSFGNWTEHVVSMRYEMNPYFQLSNIERREITYYGDTSVSG